MRDRRPARVSADERPVREAPVPQAPVVVWRFVDGKRGHEGQSEGLVRALAERLALTAHELAPHEFAPHEFARTPLGRSASGLLELAQARFPPAEGLPDPALLIGAGHATHLPMLAARRARGGRAVALMKPSLPLGWFDLCVVPEHDRVRGPNVLVTRGALTRMRPSTRHDPGRGLVLVGGPSAHHGWSDRHLIEQVEAVIDAEPAVEWTLAASRRTPAPTFAELARLAGPHVRAVPFHAVDTDWLPDELARAGRVWVTEDSVSMVFESLTAGAATGLLEVPARRVGRVARGLRALADEGLVTPFAAWREGRPLTPPATPFDEAARVARAIVERWVERWPAEP